MIFLILVTWRIMQRMPPSFNKKSTHHRDLLRYPWAVYSRVILRKAGRARYIVICINPAFTKMIDGTEKPKIPCAIHSIKISGNFGPTGKVSKKLVHLSRWTTFPGRTDWNFGWMDRAWVLSLQTRSAMQRIEWKWHFLGIGFSFLFLTRVIHFYRERSHWPFSSVLHYRKDLG